MTGWTHEVEERYKYIMVEFHLSNLGFSKYGLDPLALESPVIVIMGVGGGHLKDPTVR